MANPCSVSDAAFLGGWVSSLSLLYDDGGNPIHPSLPSNPMQSHDAAVERLPQIAGVRAAWSWLCTDLVTDAVPLGEPALCKLLEIDGLSSLAKAPLKTQRIVSHELAATAFARLQAPSSPLSQSDRVRLSSCAGYGAHAWLKAIPSTRLLMLNNNEARTSVLFMLHLPHPLLVHCPTQHTCYTMSDGHQSRHADVFGDHEMVCRNSDKLPATTTL